MCVIFEGNPHQEKLQNNSKAVLGRSAIYKVHISKPAGGRINPQRSTIIQCRKYLFLGVGEVSLLGEGAILSPLDSLLGPLIFRLLGRQKTNLKSPTGDPMHGGSGFVEK